MHYLPQQKPSLVNKILSIAPLITTCGMIAVIYNTGNINTNNIKLTSNSIQKNTAIKTTSITEKMFNFFKGGEYHVESQHLDKSFYSAMEQMFPRMFDENMDTKIMKDYLMYSESGMTYNKSCNRSNAYGVLQLMPKTNETMNKRLGITTNEWSVPNQDRKLDYLMTEYKQTVKNLGHKVCLVNVMTVQIQGAGVANKILNGKQLTENERHKIRTNVMKIKNYPPFVTTGSPDVVLSKKFIYATAMRLNQLHNVIEGYESKGKWKGTRTLVKVQYNKVLRKWKRKLKKTPFFITRYTNSAEENARRKGVKHSRHTPEYGACALDVHWEGLTQKQKTELIADFQNVGFKGFGVGPTTLHVDMRDVKYKDYKFAVWTYYKKMPSWASKALYASN